MAVSKRPKGTGGLVTKPPAPAHVALRDLERRYGEKCAELDRALAALERARQENKRLKGK